MVDIQRITTLDPLYQDERDLRNRILLRPIGLQDHAWEMNDLDSWHFVAMHDNKLIGCVVLFPLNKEKTQAQLMQMAIDNDFQGKGIGKLLVDELLKFAKEQGIIEVICHSRQSVNAFYQKLGFEIYGEPFEEVGIAHNHMKIKVS